MYFGFIGKKEVVKGLVNFAVSSPSLKFWFCEKGFYLINTFTTRGNMAPYKMSETAGVQRVNRYFR